MFLESLQLLLGKLVSDLNLPVIAMSHEIKEQLGSW